ncbi:MAG: HAMP domain-containing sensor histidine kinase [Longimicrobiales bacterium]
MSRPAVGTTLLVGFVIGTVGLASWLAWEAVDAARSHRQAAEEALADYAEVAAWESSRLTLESVDRVLDNVFDDVPRYARWSDLSDLDDVDRELDDAARDEGCVCPGIHSPTALFAVRGDEPVQIRPAGALEAAEVQTLRDEIRAHSEAGADPGRHGLLVRDAAVVLYAVTRDRGGAERALYGVVMTLEALGELSAGWYRDRTLLPPAVAGDTPQDSLVRVRLTTPAGDVLVGDGDAGPSAFTARSVLPPRFGGLVVEASVLPAAADRLVIGGLPRSRLPLLLGLLALTAGVGVAGLVEVRRHQQLARLREDFVSSVSHELRTPLTQIRMLAELLEDDKLRTPEERARSMRIIRREAQRLTMLVENILQFARTRASGPLPPPASHPVDVEPVVREAVALMEATAAQDDTRIEVDIEGQPRIQGLREGLRRIVGNLLDNALKYGPAGQTVRVRVASHGHQVRVEVTDQGPGIPAAERTSIWEPYRRLPRDVEARRPGSGMGLAVVRELVDASGGSVAVEAAPGGGARFIVHLPAAAAPAEAPPSPAAVG